MLRCVFIIECGFASFLCVMHVLKVQASSSSPRLPLSQSCFFCSLHCWASPWKKIVYSLTHSPSLFDAPGTNHQSLSYLPSVSLNHSLLLPQNGYSHSMYCWHTGPSLLKMPAVKLSWPFSRSLGIYLEFVRSIAPVCQRHWSPSSYWRFTNQIIIIIIFILKISVPSGSKDQQGCCCCCCCYYYYYYMLA